MKIAIVTGASSGLGKEFVKQISRFYKELDEIWVIARRQEPMEELKKSVPVEVRIFTGDLTEDLVYLQLKNRLENQNPDIRMLVNAAGYGKIGTVEKLASTDPEKMYGMIDINCRALTKMTCTCLSYMNPGSRIINIASSAAFCPQAKFAVYAATKSYVLSFSRALAEELLDKKIYVTAVCPGPVNTEFFDVAGPSKFLTKKGMMSEAKDVVRQALLDSRNKKGISVYGLTMKCGRAAAKILPEAFSVRTLDKFNIIEE